MCMQLMAKHIAHSIKDRMCLGIPSLGNWWNGSTTQHKGFGLAVGGICVESTGEANENKVRAGDTDLRLINKWLLKP